MRIEVEISKRFFRTVEVWMDDFKRLFYMNRPDLRTVEIGNITNR